MLTALYVVARVLANPISNVLQKRLAQRSADPVFIIGVTHGLLSLGWVPWIPGLVRAGGVSAGFWGYLLLCSVLAVASNVLLVHALRRTDLSLLGPINAYKAVVSLGLGVLLIGEVPTPMGVVGVLLIVGGSVVVVDRRADQARRQAVMEFLRDPGVRLRFAALVLSATEAVFLKKAVLLGSPLVTLVGWSILGLPLAGLAVVLGLGRVSGTEREVFRGHGGSFIALAVSTGVMQGATLLAFGVMQVGYALALFQMSALVSVVLGHQVFREGHLRRRFLGALVMVAGAVCIVLFGRAAA